MAKYNNIHRQQLFHWIGSHIDAEIDFLPRRMTDDLRDEYVNCLSKALKNGLWVKTPRVPDFLGNGDLIKVTRPITCFTEWTLGQSLPHTTRYGRLGLGFPKKFVLARGGQPLTYVRDSAKNDPYTRALKTIARVFKEGDLDGKISPRKLEVLKQNFDYLSHFNKRIKHAPAPGKRPVASKGRVIIGKRKLSSFFNPFQRFFGSTLHYLEEREWRIVYDQSIEDFFTPGPGSPGPEYFLPIKPGRELFTVVLPDNNTVNKALKNPFIRKKLYPDNAPHVTVLSLQDIGTF